MSNQSGRYRRKVVWHAALVASPIVVFTFIVLWFTRYPISPGPAVEASIANPVGFLTSNFVYDGPSNIENIVASSAFVLLVCAYYPTSLRFFFACILPFAAVGAGALAELTTVSTSFCSGSCSFYGMSGVASGMIGFAVAGFLIALGISVLQLRGRLVVKDGNTIFGSGRTGLVVLLSTFVTYVVLLLFFSGLITLPAAASGGHPAGGVSSAPPAILTQTPPVALVHTASIVYGFLLCLAVLVRANRRYRVLVLPVRR